MIVCFILSFLEHESFSFSQLSSSFLVICVHDILRFVVSFSFVNFCMCLLLFKELVARNSKVEQP